MKGSAEITEMFPPSQAVDDSVPERAKEYLEQAINSISAPAGAVMLAACAVDAMLKDKGLIEGSLHKRIEEAAAAHLITPEMAQWAHEVRVDANGQRHADLEHKLPDPVDAKRVIEFTQALAVFLYVLPTRIRRGLGEARRK